ncbi:MAG: branched-chain amino acid aminotransferase [Eubacteriales bacterium]|nr:branched-chain amino acid aminotransferase [Clostridiales bacterium]MDD7307633.1 branched-chain amino acid aminotransferase [Eubacteriales bacterium]MEE0180840.1 branched-chain amino acid aminotransferase [Anaerovoracaceae bacterium]
MSNRFSVELTKNPKQKPDPDSLRFGTVFTDHMFVMDYDPENGWHDGKIVPYGPLALDPATVVFHYGQEMFEGLKAYKTKEGKVQLFRPDMNAKRTNNTNKRMCIPQIDEQMYIDAIKELVAVDKDWIPQKPDTALYIRPFIIGTDKFLGVAASNTYKFIIILSPVGPYYESGLAPTRIYVENEFVRSAPGGTGYAKIGGNYASAMIAEQKAHDMGYDQVLWLDAKEGKYVEEIGTSNAFFKIDGELYTAPLEGTILPGITRDSMITVMKDWGYKVNEVRFTIEDVFKAAEEGRLEEVFATGTAAVISPVGELYWNDRHIVINNNEIGELSQKLYDELYGIQTGEKADTRGWIVPVE